MSNLLNLKNRIRSVKNIGQITKAMELVAATKMKKAQQRVIEARSYSNELENLINKLVLGTNIEDFNLAKADQKAEKNLLIIVGPSKGLAGSLISNLMREIYNFLKSNPDTDIITIDKKGAYIGERSGKKIIGAIEKVKTNIESDDLSGIYDLIEEEFLRGSYKKVSVVFSHFVNTLVQKPAVVDILPVNASLFENKSKEENSANGDLLIEPGRTEVINELLKKYFQNKLFLSVIDNIASEYSARMIAMKNANDNATEIKNDLTLEYNQTRQAAITQQILEIAGATAAMEGTE